MFELRLAKTDQPGPKLVSHANGPACDQPVAVSEPNLSGFPFACHSISAYDAKPGTTRVLIGARDITMNVLAGTFSGAYAGPLGLGRPVIDKTGLSGSFDFTLEWARERRPSAASDSPASPPSEPDGPTPLEALRDQTRPETRTRESVAADPCYR